MRLLSCKTFIFFLLSATLASAQQNNVRHRHVTGKEGLTQSTVMSVFKDSRGFVWFGTQDGLNRYDGAKIKAYTSDQDNAQTLAGNSITAILEDNEKRLWIGSRNSGISIYVPQTDRFIRLVHSEKDKNSISDNSINHLLLGRNNTIWVSTLKGLNSVDPKTLQVKRYQIHSTDNPEKQVDEILLVAESVRSKKLWVVSSKGLYVFDENKGEFKLFEIPGVARTRIVSANFDGSKWIYINTQRNSVKAMDVETGEIEDQPAALSALMKMYHTASEPIQVICSYRTPENKSYLGTDRKGVFVFNEKTNDVQVINADNGEDLLSNKVQSMYVDSAGTIWVGSDLGVDFFQPGKLKFKTITEKDFEKDILKSDDIMSILVDKNKLFLGTSDKGLSVINQKTGKVIDLPKGINYGSQQGVLSLLKDKDGFYWIGTWGGGLVKLDLDKNSFEQFTSSNSFLAGQNITCLGEHNNTIWIGSLDGGLYKYDKSDLTFSKFTTNNGLSSNKIYYLCFDKKQKLWIGTVDGGLNILDVKTNKIEVFRHDDANKNSLSSNTVNCIFIDEKANVAWIATDNGLNKFDLSTHAITRYFKKDGLPNNYIYSILADNNNNLWMSTNEGLTKFNPQVENTEGAAFTNYTPDDGLQGEEFNQGAFYKASDGEMFFGGLNGLSFFYPDKLTSSSHISPLFITSYKRFNKEVEMDTAISFKRHIEVSYKENSFAFEFTALDFGDPSRMRYSWKMEGLKNNDWTPPSNRNIADYPELSPGEYVFRVKASNSDGVWNEKGAYLYITVRPPWYATKAAYTLFVLIIVLGAWGYSQFRTARVAVQKKALERMVQQRTVQLAEKNRDITSSIEYARKIQDAILPPLGDIYKAFPDSFVLYKPRDIVSGDFYWFYEKGDKKIIAVVDCTGHGVPGAFMSMIGHNLLNQIVIGNGVIAANEILNNLHKGVLTALKQGNAGVESKDGMDIALCVFDKGKKEVQYAAAYRPLYIISASESGKVTKLSGDKFPIGGSHFGIERSFTLHTLPLKEQDFYYMFTDGFADQFGGASGKKFMMKQFSKLLEEIWQLPAATQQERLFEAFSKWKGENDQVDDVLVVGIKA